MAVLNVWSRNFSVSSWALTTGKLSRAHADRSASGRKSSGAFLVPRFGGRSTERSEVEVFTSSLLSSTLGVPWCSVAFPGVSFPCLALLASCWRCFWRNARTRSVLLSSSRSRFGWRLSHEAMRFPSIRPREVMAPRMRDVVPSSAPSIKSNDSTSTGPIQPLSAAVLAASRMKAQTATTSPNREPAFFATSWNLGSVTEP